MAQPVIAHGDSAALNACTDMMASCCVEFP